MFLPLSVRLYLETFHPAGSEGVLSDAVHFKAACDLSSF